MIKAFFVDDSGATAIEYGLIAGLIAVAIIGTVISLGLSVEKLFNNGSAEVIANQTAKIR